jgi:hypothetical protein
MSLNANVPRPFNFDAEAIRVQKGVPRVRAVVGSLPPSALAPAPEPRGINPYPWGQGLGPRQWGRGINPSPWGRRPGFWK